MRRGKVEMEKVLHMNGGIGESSYANNSTVQRNIMRKTKLVREESIKELYNSLKPKTLIIAEMGCGSGPNALSVVSEIMNVVNDTCLHQGPEFMVFLNDLPGNDFQSLFQFLPNFYKHVEEKQGETHFRDERENSDVTVLRTEEENGISQTGGLFVSALPGSFYGRLFPSQFLHFVHSCYSLHWLSQVPEGLVRDDGVGLNKGTIHIAKTSPEEVIRAYYKQFKRDFTTFLRSRACELVPQGRMVLTIQGSILSNAPNPIITCLDLAFQQLVSEGMIEEEKVDRFNLACYFPSGEEVRQVVEDEGSFIVEKNESFRDDWSDDVAESLENRATSIVKSIRAVMETLFTNAFGEGVIDHLFLRFKSTLFQHFATQTSQYTSVVVSLTKRPNF